jgi:hypothetical protein
MNLYTQSLKYIEYFFEEKQKCLCITNKHGMKLYVKYNNKKKEMVFVFFGSNDWNDWKNNFRFRPEYVTRKTYFHKGAYITLRESKKIILHLIEKFNPFLNEITILGHSAGGYLAQCLAYEVATSTNLSPAVYIYGSGIVLSKNIQEILAKYNIYIVQIVINNDIVPKLLTQCFPEYITIKLKLKAKKRFYHILKNHTLDEYKKLLFTSIYGNDDDV